MDPPRFHNVLHNDDILRMIFENLSAVGDGRELAGLARVCRAFSEPALDMLWKVLPCVMPLFNLLRIETRGSALLFVDGAISDYDWSRFRHYAHRVRKLMAICPSHNHEFDPSVPSELLRRSEKQPLLPYLLQLACPYPLLSAFTSGSLIALAIMAIAPYSTLDQLLGAVALEAPQLQCLILNSRASASPESSELNSVEHLKHLRMLRMYDSVSALSVSALATLPNLVDLSISLDTAMVDDLATTAQFPVLQRLTIRDGSISSVMHVLKAAITSPHFRSLTIGDTFRPLTLPPGTWRQFWQRLGDVLVPERVRSLLRLNVKCKVDVGAEVHPNVATLMELIRPLLSLSQLEDVALILGGLRVRFSVDDMRALASAWPRLLEFDLVHDNLINRPSVSMRALLEFARHCPRLQTLKMSSLDVAALRAEELEGLPTLSHGLKVLDLYSDWQGLSMAEKMQCARFLDRIFPNIQECTCEGDLSVPRVSDLLAAFQSVRREQMVRAGCTMF